MTTAPWATVVRPRMRSAKLGRLLDWVVRCTKRRHRRIAPPMLSDHLLRDIGLSPIDIAAEAHKPFCRP